MTSKRTIGGKNRSLLYGVAVAALCSSVLAACGSSDSGGSSDEGTYKAGANLCLSGSAGTIGEQMKNGFELALKVVNKAHPDYKLEMEYADSASDPQKGLTAFTDLAENKKVPIVYSCGTAVISASIQAAERSKTVLIDTASGGPQLIGASKWLFSDFINSELEVKAMSDYMYKTLGYRNIAVDHRSDAYGAETAPLFKKYWESLGGKVTVDVTHDINSAEQMTQVAKVKNVADSTDAIYLITADKDAGVFIKQARQAGIKLPFVGVGPSFTPGMLSVAGANAEKLLYTAPFYDLDQTTPETTAFKAAYAEKFGTATPPTYLTSSYDGVLLWDHVVKYIRDNKLKYTGENVQKALNSDQVFAGLGHETKFDEKRVAPVPVRVMEVTGGKGAPVASR